MELFYKEHDKYVKLHTITNLGEIKYYKDSILCFAQTLFMYDEDDEKFYFNGRDKHFSSRLYKRKVVDTSYCGLIKKYEYEKVDISKPLKL